MTFQITHDGQTYTVHTEVSDNATTQVLFDENKPDQTDTVSIWTGNPARGGRTLADREEA